MSFEMILFTIVILILMPFIVEALFIAVLFFVMLPTMILFIAVSIGVTFLSDLTRKFFRWRSR